MAIPIIKDWMHYFTGDGNEGLGSSYERIILNEQIRTFLEKYAGGGKILEAPLFGFTGLSGINSMEFSKDGYSVSLIDHDKNRIEMIRNIWNQTEYEVSIHHVTEYEQLPFQNDAFDFAWNFSAIWFVSDGESFLKELCRVTKSAILICVPNRTGLGYIVQKMQSGKAFHSQVKELFIKPSYFTGIMNTNGWHLEKDGYIDCPPWPDIGMAKEDFLKKFNIRVSKKAAYYSIMDYYTGKNKNFRKEMLKHARFERMAPSFIKMFWAHHHYYLFLPKKKQ